MPFVRLVLTSEVRFDVQEKQHKLPQCHTPVLKSRTEASIHVSGMFKSHAWQQYDKQMKYFN
jgi:hypothetical protein